MKDERKPMKEAALTKIAGGGGFQEDYVYKITDACDQCGACRGICPSNAVNDIGLHRLHIDSVKCLGCGTCEMICPRGAVVKIERND